jgi:putative transposase
MIGQHNQSLSVEALCEVLAVSPSGYYAWRKRGISPREQSDTQLGRAVERVFRASRNTYGSHRVQRALSEQGIRTSRKRVARLMRQRGLRSVRARRRRIGLTRAARNAYMVENLLAQDFAATRINEKWVTDITYVPTREGWLYLASVLDLYSRQVVGWAMGERHDAELATDALDMAIQRHRPPVGLLLHSDRGGEFASARFHQRAMDAQMRLSMSDKGNCYDNAVAESFFATVKLEAVRERVYGSRQEARQQLFDYIEVFYNRQRLHSGIDFECPVNRAAGATVTPLNWG